MMFAASLAVLSDAFPRSDERMQALAAYGATMGGSFAMDPLMAGPSPPASTGARSS